jgi:hypothetical protein
MRAEATAVGRQTAIDSGRISVWSKGLTKETDQRVADAAAAKGRAHADGTLVVWSNGLTKETDVRVAAMARANAITHQRRALRDHLDRIKRLSLDEIRDRVEGAGNMELIAADGYVNDLTSEVRVRCRLCTQESIINARQAFASRCQHCDPFGSAAQAELARTVEGWGFRIRRNDRSTIRMNGSVAELDILIPEHGLAIEYNGLYWHSSLKKSSAYHQNKSDACKAVGIQLVHVFEDEWRDRRTIVEGMLMHRLGMSTRFGARVCSIGALEPGERRRFFRQNHVDGDVPAVHALGLYHPTAGLVMAISLRRPILRKKHAGFLEVARLATASDTAIVGGLSRLSRAALAWAQNNGHAGLMTYVDTRHGSDGGSWVGHGWAPKGETPPRWWWTDMETRFNRFKYRADRARNMSETQVAEEAHVVKIHGCKNLILEMI